VRGVKEGRQAEHSRGFTKTKQTNDYFTRAEGFSYHPYMSALSSNSLLDRIKS
jgi:hypothetical protein